ncbi:isoleucine--tRNA ligase [Buchnera aphidicola]|uniref:isoleucine--tRNA ligase n=1 Tax=Buchnera aphidicola TaxID=9 RepID=UPI0031B6E200
MHFNNNNINLPKTKFSMKANLISKEIDILKKWKNEKIYTYLNNQKNYKKSFFLHDGPPYANGNIHLGHAVNKILKDIILKSKRLSNFYAPFIPCWDCHGLPIEHKIEKKIKFKEKILNIPKIHKICRQYVLQQIKKQKKDFKRLGILADWNNSNLTMNYENEANTILTLSKIIQKKNLYRDFKPIYWCMDCQSSLAEAEIEYLSKKCQTIFFTLKIFQSQKFLQKITKKTQNKNTLQKFSFIIYTTTIWTIPTCQAIAINPNIQYTIFIIKKSFFICAKNLIHNFLKEINTNQYKIVDNVPGKKFKNLYVCHPITKKKIPIIFSEHITNTLGTGIVQMSPDHGLEDFIICKKYKINPIHMINSYGIYKNPQNSYLNKIHIFKSSKIIIKILKNKNQFLFVKEILHQYPHCWRHKTPIIFRATPQWFIKIHQNPLKKKILKNINLINWVPQWGKKKMKLMIKNRPDWCISRQRIWGIPLPLFIHKKNFTLHPNTVSILKNFSKIVKKKGSQIWWNLKPKKLLKKNSSEYQKVNDIIDVWFESGSNHQLKIYKYNIKKKKNYISDLCLEGSDQHRGWFMSSLIISTYTKSQIPYYNIITHGFVVDQKKQKMSKSLGNIVSPQEIIKKWGADILRLWVAYTNYSNEMSISEYVMQQTSEYYRRIRNTIRFILSNLHDFTPSKNSITFLKMLKIDQWILNLTKKFQKNIIKNYSHYNFQIVIKKILNFCSIQLSSKYFEITKDRLYMFQKNSLERRSIQTALYHILEYLIRWISPILSFTADEIWNYVPEKNKKYIFFEKWYELPNITIQKNIFNSNFWKTIFLLRREVHKNIEKKREKKKISSNSEVKIIFYITSKISKLLRIINSNELPIFFSVSQIQLKNYIIAPINLKKNKYIKNCKILIKKSIGKKCIRCWQYVENFKKNFKNTNICARCFTNVYGIGEKRKFF